MAENDLDEVEENIRILVREELETGHWLDGHPRPVSECPVCQARAGGVVPPGPDRG
jgi:hypothetical protein